MPNFTVTVKTKYVEVQAFHAKFVYTKEEFANTFGETPVDDAHARTLILDYCGEDVSGSPYKRSSKLVIAV